MLGSSRRRSEGMDHWALALFLGTSRDSLYQHRCQCEKELLVLLETKDVGSLGHQTMPCLRIQFYPTYVRFWLSQSSHIRMHIVLYNVHFSHQKKGNRHIGLGGHQRMVCIWLRSSCFRIRQGLLDLEAVGWDTQAEKCALLFKLKQRDLPQGSSMKR